MPDLAAVMAKLKETRRQVRLSERNTLEALAAFLAEAEVVRAETAASHAGIPAKIEAMRAQLDKRVEEHPTANKPNRFVM